MPASSQTQYVSALACQICLSGLQDWGQNCAKWATFGSCWRPENLALAPYVLLFGLLIESLASIALRIKDKNWATFRQHRAT